MNWGKLLNDALNIGLALNSVNNVDKWINEKLIELSSSNVAGVYAEIAYEIAEIDNDTWKYLVAHMKVKAIGNEDVNHLYNYCNYVIQVENKLVSQLYSYSISEAVDLLVHSFGSMELYDKAAHYGVLQAHSKSNMKANAILGSFNRYLQ